MRRDATLEEVFACLKDGGRAWWISNEIKIECDILYFAVDREECCLYLSIDRLTGWQIEDKDVGYVDIVPELLHGDWVVATCDDGFRILSSVINSHSFMGYVWEEGKSKELLNTNPTMWRTKNGGLINHYYDDATIERCKAVRFKT